MFNTPLALYFYTMESTSEMKDKPANIKTPYHAPKHFKITVFCDTLASGRLVPEVI